MGFLIILSVGATLGWLASILVDREDRTSTTRCVVAGAFGSLLSAMLLGKVSLLVGISPQQLLYGGLGGVIAIGAVNLWQRASRTRA